MPLSRLSLPHYLCFWVRQFMCIFVYFSPRFYSIIRFWLFLFRSVKIYALGGNYYWYLLFCCSLSTGGFHKSPDGMACCVKTCASVYVFNCTVYRKCFESTHTKACINTVNSFHTSSCITAARKWIDKDLMELESESLPKVKGCTHIQIGCIPTYYY